MQKLKSFLPATLLALSAFAGTTYAAEIDLIYNFNHTTPNDSRAAWHGARIAKQVLKTQGKNINLVLYNGQSVPNLNAAIGKMRAKSDATAVVIGFGSPQEVSAAAKPLLTAGKIFISASPMNNHDKQILGKHFFAVPTTAKNATATAQFENMYETRFHQKPSQAAHRGYRAVMLAAEALNKTTGQTSAQLAQNISRLERVSPKA